MRRAYEGCDALYAAIQGCLKGQANPVTGETDPKTGHYVVGVEFEGPPPLELAVTTGEILFLFRSALDHLAYGLGERHSNPPPSRTEFPIFKDSDAFYRRGKGGQWHSSSGMWKIRGLAESAQTVIQELQPFNSGEDPHVLLALHDLNNIDKHRLLHLPRFRLSEAQLNAIAIYGDLELIEQREAGPLDLKTEIFRLRPIPDSKGRFDVQVDKSWVELDISFDDTGPGRGAAVMEFFSVLSGYLASDVFPRFSRFFQ